MRQKRRSEINSYLLQIEIPLANAQRFQGWRSGAQLPQNIGRYSDIFPLGQWMSAGETTNMNMFCFASDIHKTLNNLFGHQSLRREIEGFP